MSLTSRIARRELLRRSLALGAALAGAGVLAGCERPGAGAPAVATLPPPETKTVRLARPFACDAPMWLAREFLLEEGFTDVQYVDGPGSWAKPAGAEFGASHPEAIVPAVDAGMPIVALAGLHSGCQELWAAPGIASVRDLRGKRIAIFAPNIIQDQFYSFFATLFSYVGIDPLKDVSLFQVGPDYAAMLDAFIDGRSDAFLAAAEGGSVLRRQPRNPGTKILDQTTEKPWSQYSNTMPSPCTYIPSSDRPECP